MTVLNREQQPASISMSVATLRKKLIHVKHDGNTREANRYISSSRSAIKKCIAHRKNGKILATGYRGRPTEPPNLIHAVTRLELYRYGW
ncbi:hypothetical protein C5C66_03245 [Rathayibacter toxicus]|uniref:Uncharacterized protein n=1 Tax=Rathayibacter toxicus TaxID=145458 RepID=A0A0C5BE34_9MICO|nr:hypothetical protein TI83_03430 [Rathayibacter toxicus]ALS56866.1 hypothetical protein APU90_03040 [Rathayibacter toxicus]KKM46292.1 hypothetical protein VT73_04450 [Rathayibacter toxicus]PPG23263.1 hypothetical protein C5D15_03220 [Rathayibacter toxicus]PPH24989.1 hypothetical protein C5D17_03195 [Rathayibacter toxicus]